MTSRRILNATSARLHWELTKVWATVDEDPNVKGVLVTGAGKAFSAVGDSERIGLVSLCAPPDQLMERAWNIADRLASGSRGAIRLTKRALNNWLRVAGPTFDTSLAYEMLNFTMGDVHEGIAAIKEKRSPNCPSARGGR